MSSFRDGYESFARLANANHSVIIGERYVKDVEEAIEAFAKDMNSLGFTKYEKPTGRSLHDLKGRAAELWHKGTFNVKTKVKGSDSHVSKVPERGRDGAGDPDLQGDWGDDYGVKYYKTAKESAKQQANPAYERQNRIVPSDQYESAKEWLQRKIQSEVRPEQVKRYQEALDMLTDRIRNGEGVESIPLTEEDAKKIAKVLKEGGFDPKDFGITTETMIEWQDIMDQAYAAGLSAAVISIVLEVAPHLIDTIIKLIREGEIDANDFKRVGFAALKGSTLGFVRGTVASALTIACKAGKLGVELKSINPALIGTIVALTMNAIQNATLVAFGQITKRELATRCIQDLAVTSCAIAFGKFFQATFGTTLQVLLPQLPTIGFMIGSFVGSAVGAFVYKTAYSCVISYCVDTGCTFFGLVEQDYTLPENLLKEIGLHIFEYEKFIPKQVNVKQFKPKEFITKKFAPQETQITVLRRGVIGVNCIGYV